MLAHAKGTRTIEATGKLWKFCQLVGGLGVIACGIGTCVMSQRSTGADSNSTMMVLGLVASVLLLIAGKLGAWWFHG